MYTNSATLDGSIGNYRFVWLRVYKNDRIKNIRSYGIQLGMTGSLYEKESSFKSSLPISNYKK